MLRFNRYFPVYFEANDGAAGGGAETPPAAEPETPDTPEVGATPGKTFSQEEFNKATEAARRDGERRGREAADKKHREAEMSENERLKTQKDEADKAAEAANKRAGDLAVKYEARDAARRLGVPEDGIDFVLKAADLSAISIGEDGAPDATAVKAAIEAVTTKFPALIAKPGAPPPSGGEFGGAPPQDLDSRIKAAQEAGDAKSAIALKMQKFNT